MQTLYKIGKMTVELVQKSVIKEKGKLVQTLYKIPQM